MKRCLLLLCAALVAGCSYGQNYLENPESLIRDPHFAAYKDKRDDLESSYLRKEITYAEYIDKRDELDDQYTKEVNKRNSVIVSTELESGE